MKKLFIIFMLFFSLNSFAQDIYNEDSKTVYCQLLGTAKILSNKVVVSVDFGQETSFWEGQSFLVDENGKKKTFNSMIDAMNFMGKLGWEFRQAYVVTVSNENIYH